MTMVEYILGALVCLGAGIGLGFWMAWLKQSKARASESAAAQSILENARREAENVVGSARIAANEEVVKLRSPCVFAKNN